STPGPRPRARTPRTSSPCRLFGRLDHTNTRPTDMRRLTALLVALPVLLTPPPVRAPVADKVKVVTSLTTYGAIAREIVGDRGIVNSIATGDENPHYVQQRYEARLGLDVVWVFVAGGDGVDDASVADDFASDGAVRRERRDDFDLVRDRRPDGRRCHEDGERNQQCSESTHVSRSRVCVVQSPKQLAGRTGSWRSSPRSWPRCTAPVAPPTRSATA